MNKKIIGFLLAIPALMGFGLTSCSDEVTMAVPGQEKEVDVTLTAKFADFTRATLTPENNKIKFEWEMDDEVLVVNAENGKYLGKLTVSGIQESDHRVCQFAGKAQIPAGKVKLNFFYLGKAGSFTTGENRTVNDYEVNFASQNGSAESFSDNDILMAKNMEYTNAQDGNLGMINFSRDFAYGRFILKYNDEVVDLAGKTVTICANPEKEGVLKNKATLNFQSASYEYESGAIAVTLPDNYVSDEGFYVSFPATEKVSLKFVVNNFDGSKGSTALVADRYYTANDNGDPIIVKMRHSDGSDDLYDFTLTYAPNYEGENVPESIVEPGNGILPYSFTVKGYDTFTRAKHVLTGWKDGNGKAYAAGASFTFDTANPNSATLYAQWAIDYKATLKYENGTTEEKKPEGDDPKVDLPNLEDKDDEEFVGWKKEGSDDETATKGPWEFEDDDPQVTLVPVYKPKTYTWTITWKDVDDSIEAYKTQSVENKPNGTKFYTGTNKPSDPTKEGYEFTGWTYNGSALPSTITLDSEKINVEIVAQWRKLCNVSVTWFDEDGTAKLDAQAVNTVVYGTEIAVNEWAAKYSKEIPTKAEDENYTYEFDKWVLVTPEAVSGKIKVTDDTDVVFKATYTATPKPADPVTVATPGYQHGTFTPNASK